MTTARTRAIRLPSNQILQDKIGYLLKRPVSCPPIEVRRYYASFSYQARSWKTARRLVAKVEWHPGELYPRVGLHVVAVQADETRVEVGLIGREGMSGVAAIGRKRDNLGAPNVFWAALRSAIRARRRRRTVDETVKEIPLRMLNTRMRERAGESLCCDLRPKSDVAPHERARDVPPLN